MAVISAGKGSRSAAGSIKYVQFEKDSTHARLVLSDGVECSPYYQDTIHDFACIRQTFNKENGRQAHHMVLAFSPEEEARFSQKELFNKSVDIAKAVFPQHQVWLGMHADTDHLHVHMIVNSVNFETGRKLQIAGRKGMHELMEKVQIQNKELGLDSNLRVGERNNEYGHVNTHNIIEHKMIEQGKSWKADMARTVHGALQHSTDRLDFIYKCSEAGIACNWSQNRKHITFSYLDDSSKKVRNTNLAKTFNLVDFESKETLQHSLNLNFEIQNQQINREEKAEDLFIEQTQKIIVRKAPSRGLER